MDGDAVTLRPCTEADAEAILAVQVAQELAWFGEADTDDDDMSTYVALAVSEHGSLEAGTRVAVAGDRVIGMALLHGHGQTIFAVDPNAPGAGTAQGALLDWQVAGGASRIDAPAQDADRLAALEARGFRPVMSSFDLERLPDIDDLGEPMWPEGVELEDFRPGEHDQEVHDLVYSVWTDVPGHTYRPLEEWQALFVSRATFEPGLAVLARMADGALGGVSINCTFSDIGWVQQLAVGYNARGLGLGRALLVESFRRLAPLPGVERLGLSVEAANSKALGLYRSVGLDVTREWFHCERADTPESAPTL